MERDRDSDRDRRREHTDDPDRDDHFTIRDVVASYNAKAPTLVRDYEDLLFEEVHAPVLDLLPDPGAHILDMGAGSGRDAAWFATNGYKVLAAEPAAEMRNLGKALHPSPNIRWLDDAPPTQKKVLRSKLTFDLIWLSAVWMHVPPSARARAFRKLVSAMSPGGSMMLTLRQGPSPADRPMEPATAADVEVLARRHGLQTVRSERIPDILERDGIAWEVIWLRLPDDGTGALPLLRHVVLNDRKSSTYKLALLRTVIRVADGAGGLARPGRDERFVDLPLGLVALFWVRSFKPLIAKNLPQHPAGNARLAFVKDGFRRLQARSAHDLGIGRRFTGDDWRHDIVIERVADGEPNIDYPAFVDGKRRCPPENVGGIPGFMQFLEAARDPMHSEHRDMIRVVRQTLRSLRYRRARHQDGSFRAGAAEARGLDVEIKQGVEVTNRRMNLSTKPDWVLRRDLAEGICGQAGQI